MSQPTKDLQLAEILSDLVSLRPGVCHPAAALALVSARPLNDTKTKTKTALHNTALREDTSLRDADTDTDADADADADVDLHRARELVRLHYQVREASKKGGLGRELMEARRDVERALG